MVLITGLTSGLYPLALLSKALTYVTLIPYLYVPQLCRARTFLEQLRGSTQESYFFVWTLVLQVTSR